MCHPPVPRSRPQRSRHADRLIAMMTALRLGQPPRRPQGPPQPLLPRTPPRQQRLRPQLTLQPSRLRHAEGQEAEVPRKVSTLAERPLRRAHLRLLTMTTTTQPPGQRHAEQAVLRRRTLNRLPGAPRPRGRLNERRCPRRGRFQRLPLRQSRFPRSSSSDH